MIPPSLPIIFLKAVGTTDACISAPFLAVAAKRATVVRLLLFQGNPLTITVLVGQALRDGLGRFAFLAAGRSRDPRIAGGTDV